jgi:selenocysteine lyase/cysteine desulfurase
VLARWRTLTAAFSATFVGDGAVLYAADIGRESPASVVAAAPNLAGAIGLLAVDRALEALEPAGVRPLYVRRPDAEIARDEKLLSSKGSSKDT